MNRIGQLLLISIFLFPLTVAAAGSIEKTGTVLQILIPGIAYGSTFYLDDEKGRIQFYKSFATNFAITEGLKYTVDKKRPNGSGQSFPSGHTSAAFQGASFIHKRYGFIYAIPAYIAASYVGYSRVESRKHYVEDVLAGAAIGIASSFYFATPYKGVKVKAIVDNGIYGVNMSLEW